MTLAWELRLSASTKIVLLALCDWANDEGICFPSITRIATRASLSPRQCKRVLRQLVEDHWVRVIGNLTGGASSRRYQIDVEALRRGDIHDTGDNLSPVSPMSPEGCHPCHPGGVTHVTRTTKEPSIEPPQQPPSEKCTLVPPQQLPDQERVVVVKLLEGLDSSTGQSLLDELAGQMAAGKIRTTPSNFMRALVGRAHAGRFTPAYGPSIAARRTREVSEREARLKQSQQRSRTGTGVTQARLQEICALLGKRGDPGC